MKEKNDCVNIFKNIMVKCRGKKFAFSDNFNPENVVGYGIKRTNTWGDISAELKKIIPSNHQHKFGFVFLSRNFEKHYGELKNYFINQLYLITQFGITRKLGDPKRGNTMQFNLIEQFNIKIGGENHYINFVKENLMKESDVYLVIGLKSQVNRKTGKIRKKFYFDVKKKMDDNFLFSTSLIFDENIDKLWLYLRDLSQEASNIDFLDDFKFIKGDNTWTVGNICSMYWVGVSHITIKCKSIKVDRTRKKIRWKFKCDIGINYYKTLVLYRITQNGKTLVKSYFTRTKKRNKLKYILICFSLWDFSSPNNLLISSSF